MAATGLLFSQVGYDLGGPKRAFFRAPEREALAPDTPFRMEATGKSAPKGTDGTAAYWGTCWGSHWWILDFSVLNSGTYTLSMDSSDGHPWKAETIEIGDNLLWDRCVHTMAIEQFEERARRARNRIGWKDCGATLRELCSHATAIIGLCELLENGFEWMTPDQNRRLADQIAHGCRYVMECQDKADAVGLPKGSFVHEVTSHPFIVQTDAAQAVVALSYASRLLGDTHPEFARKLLERARLGYRYIRVMARPTGPSGFSALNHGAPEDYEPPREWMTRELLMQLWAAFDLWLSGADPRYREDAINLARRILARQIPEAEAEDGLWGHFRVFDGSPFTEKANVHHGIGHDTGGIFPSYVRPLHDMVRRWSDHPEAEGWKQAVVNYANGYLKPACASNPFNLLPEGHFPGQGLLTFCGPWHGINVSYAWNALLCAHLEQLTGDPAFRDIAVSNLQWIAGLNVGLTRDMFGSSVRFHPEIPERIALPYSHIHGIGTNSVEVWSSILGSVGNGISANPQFTLTVAATRENDRPAQYTDEDWIPHSSAWVGALANLRMNRFFTETQKQNRDLNPEG